MSTTSLDGLSAHRKGGLISNRQRPDASVIVPTYQQPTSLRLVLQCLLAQTTTKTYEVIICDDGSTSETFSSCHDLIHSSRVPVYWVWQQDAGFRLAASRNNAVSLASGRYLVFLDGDMVPGRSFLEMHLEAHREPGRLVSGRRRWRSLDQISARLPLDPEDLWRFLDSADSITPTTKAVEWLEQRNQRRLLESAQPWLSCFGCNLSMERTEAVRFDESFQAYGFEDSDLAYRLVRVEGLRVHQQEGAEAFHLSEKDQSPWVTSDSDTITRYLSNFCYLLDKWPDAFAGLDAYVEYMPFELDAETNAWVVARPSLSRTRKDLQTFLLELRHWLRDNGLYPQQAANREPLAASSQQLNL